tara:strand:+ start:1261 stop:2739 length:1479 start_codon:yes stop_codon:yes gene_type:complete
MITWQDVQKGIFSGESGGDYNALFGYQNREDGIFSDVKLTDMTLDEALSFADPQGEYASYVSYNNDGEISTPMGAYQIVGKTLRDAKEALKLSGDTKFSKETQDKIAKWILKTQGTDAWVGYKGTRVPPQTEKGTKKMAQTPLNAFNPNNPMQMMQMPTQGGLMGFLRDPRTRNVMSALSRTSTGARLNQLAQADMATQQTRQVANRTAQYLRTQEGGEPYAQAIEAGMDPKAVYNSFMGKGLNSTTVQSSKELPDGSGYSYVNRDGSVAIRLVDNTVLEGELARRYLAASTARKADIDRRTAGAKSLGSDEIKKAREDLDGLDMARIKANQTINRAQAIIDNPNIEGVTGRIDGIKLFYADQDKTDLVILINQFKDTLGEQAFQSLKGAGAITETELSVATKALIDLDRTQSARQFLSQMEEIKQYLTDGIIVAEQKAKRLSELLAGNTENFAPVPPIDVEALKAEIAGTSNVISSENPNTTENVTETVLD